MKYISFPDQDQQRPASYFFAVEEYCATHYPNDDLFFGWRVLPTVIFGRHQLIENEVNTDYCREHGIAVHRRRSGGGCVYADGGVIKFTRISNNTAVGDAFAEFTARMAETFRKLGVEATVSGRNDILVGGRKVSGCAFYNIKNRSVLHNTILYNTDLTPLSHALTPSSDKLASKGVASVRSRVDCLGRHTNLSIEEFAQFMRREMCGDEVLQLTAEDLEAIAALQQRYASDEWIYGKNPPYTEYRRDRFEGVGMIEAQIRLHNGTIDDIQFAGDFFQQGDIDQELAAPLRGVALEREAVAKTIAGIDLQNVIRNLKAEMLLRLLFG